MLENSNIKKISAINLNLGVCIGEILITEQVEKVSFIPTYFSSVVNPTCESRCFKSKWRFFLRHL
jgi:hypothetical protein